MIFNIAANAAERQSARGKYSDAYTLGGNLMRADIVISKPEMED